MDCIERITRDVQFRLCNLLTAEQLQQVQRVLIDTLHEYTVSKAKSSLIPYSETENEAVIKHFIVAKEIEGLSNKTLRYYSNEIIRFTAAAQKPLSEVSTNDIRYYLAMRMSNGAGKVTADNTLRILRSFFGWATVEEIIAKDPTKAIKKIKSDKVMKLPFTEEELEKLRASMQSTRDKAMLEFLFSTGARVSEAVAVNRRDIDFLAERCVVFGKGAKERYVYLNAKSLFWLKQYLGEREDDNEALFVSKNSPHHRLQKSAFETILREQGRECGVSDVHPHRFRRTAATFALRRGMPIDQVRQMLGHATIQTTLLYALTDDSATRDSHKKYVV